MTEWSGGVETDRVAAPSASDEREAAVVLLAATLGLPQLFRALVVGQVHHFLRLALVPHLRRSNAATLREDRHALARYRNAFTQTAEILTPSCA